ncbi:unnamed protein product, partial [Linum tenue]
MMHSVDYPLLVAFIEGWQQNTNTFHMSFGEMTITLHDVSFLLQIPVNGELLVSPARGDPPFISGMIFLGFHIRRQCQHVASVGSTVFVDKSSDRARGWLCSYF